MKYLVIIVLLLVSLQVSSQTKKDYKQVLALVIDNFHNDSINVYFQFNNSSSLSKLEELKRENDLNYLKEHLNDSIIYCTRGTSNFILELNLFSIQIDYYSLKDGLEKTENQKIKSYKSNNLNKDEDIPIAYISAPIFSINSVEAIIYSKFYCGSMCGSEGYYLLVKVNGDWEIKRFKSLLII